MFWTILFLGLCLASQLIFSMGDPTFVPAPTDLKSKQKAQRPSPSVQEQQENKNKKPTTDKKTN